MSNLDDFRARLDRNYHAWIINPLLTLDKNMDRLVFNISMLDKYNLKHAARLTHQ